MFVYTHNMCNVYNIIIYNMYVHLFYYVNKHFMLHGNKEEASIK